MGYASSGDGMSVETMTSVALITATAGLPFFSFNRFTDEVLISDTILCPPPMSITTSLITAPFRIEAIVPANWLGALRAMI
jgi:hypothetical protein